MTLSSIIITLIASLLVIQNVNYTLADPLTRCKENGVISITFDDGPYIHTNGVLDVLKEKDVKATFFINGGQFLNLNEEAQKILKRVLAEGHNIGSHTWDHKNLAEIGPDEIRKEMTELSDALIKLGILKDRPTFMRPPYGDFNGQVVGIVEGELGYTMVNWSIDTMDWAHPGDTEAGLKGYKDMLENAEPGSTQGFIALHHDIQVGAEELATAAIDYARGRGYRFVSLQSCLGNSRRRH